MFAGILVPSFVLLVPPFYVGRLSADVLVPPCVVLVSPFMVLVPPFAVCRLSAASLQMLAPQIEN